MSRLLLVHGFLFVGPEAEACFLASHHGVDVGLAIWPHAVLTLPGESQLLISKWNHYFIVGSATNPDLKIKDYFVD